MTIQEKVPSSLEKIPEIVSRVLTKVKNTLTEDEEFDVRVSLEEALVNAIKHGNKMRPDFWVFISLGLRNSELMIKVRDQGEGFNFKALPDPTHKGNIEKLSGRGVFLIKSLMDKVEFSDCGRVIKMIKFLKRGKSHPLRAP